jgi:sporulation-control protein
MGITRRSGEAGGAGLTVRTTLENPSTRPGLIMAGEVLIVGDHGDAPVDHIVLGLFTEVEVEADDGWLVEFYRVAVSEAFPVPATSRRVVPFSLPVPYETPLTHARGAQLGGMAMGLRVELELARKVEPQDLMAVAVHPLPVQQLILDAFVRAGFRLRQVRVQGGQIPRVAQILPFYQDFGFWAAAQYADRITEVGLIFVTDPVGAEVILAIDRWAHADSGVPTSTHRIRVEHAAADTTDWDALVDRWVNWAVAWHVRRYHYRYLYRVGPQTYRIGRRASPMGIAGAGGEDHDDGTGSTT